MALGIVKFNVFKLRGIMEGRHVPVELTEPLVDGREAGADIGQVALEVLHVDGIESDDGRVETHVGFGDGLAKVVWAWRAGEVLLYLLERLEQDLHVLLVRFLGARVVWGLAGALVGIAMTGKVPGKTAFVHSVVDVIVRPAVGLFDRVPQGRGEKVDFLVFVGNQVVEFIVHHSDDLAALVADDLVKLLVVQSRHSKAAFIVGVIFIVDVTQMRK